MPLPSTGRPWLVPSGPGTWNIYESREKANIAEADEEFPWVVARHESGSPSHFAPWGFESFKVAMEAVADMRRAQRMD